MAEERQGVITLEPTDVNLYDLIVEDKKRRANAPAGSLPLGGPDSSSDTVSIREMLAGVKTSDGNFYYQQAWHGAMKNQLKEEPQMAQNPRERVSRVIRSHGRSLYIHCIKRHPKSKGSADKMRSPRFAQMRCIYRGDKPQA